LPGDQVASLKIARRLSDTLLLQTAGLCHIESTGALQNSRMLLTGAEATDFCRKRCPAGQQPWPTRRALPCCLIRHKHENSDYPLIRTTAKVGPCSKHFPS